jgi:phage shock protein A
MGLFRRVSDILSANLNDLVDRYEDPEQLLRQAIREMETAVGEASDDAVKVLAGEKLLARQLDAEQAEATRWRGRAARAVSAGDDPLARRALVRKAEHERVIAALEDELERTRGTARQLRRQIDAMRVRLGEARRKLASLTARTRAADARRKLGDRLAGWRDDDAASSLFVRMCQKAERAEAEADAREELSASPWTEPDEAEDDAAIEAELAAIKAAAPGA